MTLWRLSFVTAFLCVPAAAHGQDPDFVARLDAATLAAVQPTLEAAARDSVPMQALQSKVLEGVAKGVPTAQIAQVAASLADELREARSALRAALPDTPLDNGEIVAVATAARQGIGVEVVRALWESRASGQSLEVPVTILGELVRRGIPVEEAATLMTHVVQASIPLQLAAQIPGKFDGALGAGALPSGALAEALRVLNIPSPPSPPPGRGPNR